MKLVQLFGEFEDGVEDIKRPCHYSAKMETLKPEKNLIFKVHNNGSGCLIQNESYC